MTASVLHLDARPRGSRLLRLLSLAPLLAAGGCFATRNDVRVVQTDVQSLRMEMVRLDVAQREALANTTRLLQAAADSLTNVSARTVSIQGDVRGETRAIREQLLQIQSLLGQSQANILRLRQELEARNSATVPPPPVAGAGTTPPVAGTTPPDSAAMQGGPGPAQLLQSGMDMLRRGSSSTARLAFQELLTRYPDSDLAPDAHFHMGDAYAREKNYSAADASYAAVGAKYPDSPRAPTALFKRAMLFVEQKNPAQARPLLQQVIARYPRTLEAERAADELAAIR